MKRITVLLADDNRVVRRAFRKILELEDDLEVVGEAKNGKQAVAMAKKLRTALVLMDIAMPLLDGLQATRQILESALLDTKVLMLSVYSDEAYVMEAVDSGAAGAAIALRIHTHVREDAIVDAVPISLQWPKPGVAAASSSSNAASLMRPARSASA